MKNTISTIALVALSAATYPTVFQEMEPNDTPQTANVISGIEDFDGIWGQVQVDWPDPDLPVAECDYFSITMGPTERGLYRNEIWTNMDRHIFITEGLAQTYHGSPDLLASRWYSFTGAQPLSFGVTASYFGSPSNYASDIGYQLTYRRARVQERDLGQFQPGRFRFREINPGFPPGNRMDVLVLDSNGRIVPGGLNMNPTTEMPCDVSVTLQEGDYYLLFSRAYMRAEITRSSGTPPPPMTPGNFVIARRETVLDTARDVSFQITTSTGALINRPVGFEYFSSGQDLVLYKMTVVPEPVTILAFGGGVAGIALRRRAFMRNKQ